jgi:hypothetical protein
MFHHVLKFDPSGQGHSLYTETLDLAAIGPLEIRRAASIEFNHHSRHWEVRAPDGSVLHHDPSRAACLLWEHQYFNR